MRKNLCGPALCVVFTILLGCVQLGSSSNELPGRFQDIALGTTLNDVKIRTNATQPSATHLRLHTPTDRIQQIDFFFSDTGDYLVEILIRHHASLGVSFESFVAPLAERHGPPHRSTEEDEDGVRIFVARWSTPDREYVVRARPRDSAGTNVTIVEHMVDLGFLRRLRREDIWRSQRDHRRIFEQGRF